MTKIKGSNPVLSERIDAMRRFNRFYTRQIGVLQEALLDSEFSLTEVRVLFELNGRTAATATELVRDLNLDGGYLSRLLGKLEKTGLIVRQASAGDARQSHITLTAKGAAKFADLDARSYRQVDAMLQELTGAEQRELLGAMTTVERLLGSDSPPGSYVLRAPEPGDLGWIVHRHGVLYAREFGWNDRFEGLVAQVVADFVGDFDAKTDRCWLAEAEGEILGSVFLVHGENSSAQLRLLYVEPKARGKGVGARLVDECLRFARRASYARVTLWTNDVLISARRLYEAAGFQLIASEPHERFGPAVIGQNWELVLDRED